MSSVPDAARGEVARDALPEAAARARAERVEDAQQEVVRMVGRRAERDLEKRHRLREPGERRQLAVAQQAAERFERGIRRAGGGGHRARGGGARLDLAHQRREQARGAGQIVADRPARGAARIGIAREAVCRGKEANPRSPAFVGKPIGDGDARGGLEHLLPVAPELAVALAQHPKRVVVPPHQMC
jgi:hypothetical protein